MKEVKLLSERACVLLDTSSLMAACLYPEREPARILKRIYERYQLVASSDTLAELSGVIARDKFDRWQPLDVRKAWFDTYLLRVKIWTVTQEVADCRDPKDNKFLSLALAASATIIVSSDDDLLVLHPYRGIDVLTLEDFKQKHLQTPNQPG
jgi:uncharacterized protein